MSPQTQIRITHKNDLRAYLSGWKTQMDIRYNIIAKREPEKSRRYHMTRIPQPIESFSFNSDDFSILLRCLDNTLRILEETPVTPIEFPYQAYAEARVFLKTFFIFLRILLDDLAGIIEYFYKKNEKLNLPEKFDDLLKKADKSKRTKDLSKLLRPRHSWKAKGTLMKMMKIITLHPLVIVVERICASASEIRRTWDPSPCDGRGN